MRDTVSPNRPATPVRRRHGWWWALIAMALVVALSIAAAPYALRIWLEHWLTNRGAAEVSVGELHANPFSGKLHISDLSMADAQGVVLRAGELSTRLLWRAIPHRELRFERLAVKDAELHLSKAVRLWSLPRTDADWPLEFQTVELSNVELQVPAASRSIALHIDRGTLTPWSSRPATTSKATLTGTLEGAPLRLDGSGHMGDASAAGEAKLEIDDLDLSRTLPLENVHGRASVNLHLLYRQDDAQQFRIAHEGTVRIEALQIPSATVGIAGSKTVWAGNGEVQFEAGALRLQQQGQLTMEQPRVQLSAGHYRADSMDWHGHMQAHTGSGHDPAVSIDGTLQAHAVIYQSQRTGLRVTARVGGWQGLISQGVADVPGGLSAQGQLGLADLHLARELPARDWMWAARAELRNVDVKGTYRAVAQALELTDYRIWGTPEAPGPLQGRRAVFENVSISDRRRFQAEHLALEDLQLELRRQTDGAWVGFAIDEKPAQSPNSNSWRIGRIELQGHANEVRYEDYSTQPPFRRRLRIGQFTLGELDSDRPRQPTPMALQGRLDDGTGLVSVGKLMPFTGPLNLSLKTKARRIPLTSLSSYSARHLGYRIAAGTARVESNLHIIDDQLRSDNHVRIRDLQLQRAGSAGSAEFRNRLGLPLPVAVRLMQDQLNGMGLSVPVRGNLAEDNFELATAITHALAESLHKATLRTANNTLHPFAASGTVADEGLRLEPVRFRADSAALGPAARTYLRRLAALLELRPAVRVEVCGAGPSAAMAQQRSEAVLAALRDKGIESNRLLPCKSTAERGADQSGVALMLR